ncbi:iron-sulfur cluster assembly accessory protein [Candidatus Woesearchaeota archaeon]|nr:iron-sulfur cluster assembly accessory protein [Candidatus Woesearchaeota archaeon]
MPEQIIADVSPKALEKIVAFIADLSKNENKPITDYYLRVFVEGGGCAGYRFGLAVEDQTKIQQGDNVQKFGNLEVRVDAMSAMYLPGSIVEYAEGPFGSGGFTVLNPNASGSCGCGNSFSV